jgi:hypothetical protein
MLTRSLSAIIKIAVDIKKEAKASFLMSVNTINPSYLPRCYAPSPKHKYLQE